MRRLLAAFVSTIALSVALAGPALGDDTVVVGAQVTMAAPCLTISPSTLNFGTNVFSTASQPATSTVTVTYTSCSLQSERVFARGSAGASGPGGVAQWSLLTSTEVLCPDAGLNKYWLSPHTTGPGPHYDLSSAYDQQLETAAPGADGAINQLTMMMPCSGSAGAATTMTFQVTYTASF